MEPHSFLQSYKKKLSSILEVASQGNNFGYWGTKQISSLLLSCIVVAPQKWLLPRSGQETASVIARALDFLEYFMFLDCYLPHSGEIIYQHVYPSLCNIFKFSLIATAANIHLPTHGQTSLPVGMIHLNTFFVYNYVH